MKTFKNITIGILTAVLSFVATYGGYELYAEEFGFQSEIAGFQVVKSAYHSEMNDYFNAKISSLVEILEKDDFASDPNFSVPVGVNSENYKDLCSEENVSTYCVAMGALDRYAAYVETLSGVTGDLINFEITDATTDSLGSYSGLLNLVTVRNEEIALEIEEAEQVMQSTIAAYNEFRLAYPMHRQYENLINTLTKYKLALQDVRQRVEKFPSKFVDASSVICE